MRLIRRAIRNRWPIKEAKRQLIVQEVASILEESAPDRTHLAAARVLIAADQVNVQDESTRVCDNPEKEKQ